MFLSQHSSDPDMVMCPGTDTRGSGAAEAAGMLNDWVVFTSPDSYNMHGIVYVCVSSSTEIKTKVQPA